MGANQDRKSILTRIRGVMGDESVEGNIIETQVFCINDGAIIPTGSWRPEEYTHNAVSYTHLPLPTTPYV